MQVVSVQQRATESPCRSCDRAEVRPWRPADRRAVAHGHSSFAIRWRRDNRRAGSPPRACIAPEGPMDMETGGMPCRLARSLGEDPPRATAANRCLGQSRSAASAKYADSHRLDPPQPGYGVIKVNSKDYLRTPMRHASLALCLLLTGMRVAVPADPVSSDSATQGAIALEFAQWNQRIQGSQQDGRGLGRAL